MIGLRTACPTLHHREEERFLERPEELTKKKSVVKKKLMK